jgi:diketogulonate reductase-like aldo/keto reductase
MKSFTLSGGIEMPVLGIGTWLHGDTGNQMRDAVVQAVEMGYRHIDCAYIYLNEPKMGEAFATIFEKGLAKREELFITGKLWGTEHAKDRVEASCRKSLADCQLDYFDLYLIHWPTGFISKNGNLPKNEDGSMAFSGVSIEETWLAMEDLVKKGLTKAIGISNFNSEQITRLMKIGSMKPVVLQVESNPRFQNEAIRRFCVKHGIQMVGYSPFGSPDLPWGKTLPHILVEPILKRIAEEVNKSTAQVVLKYQLQRGVAPIPKSIHPHELEANLDIEDDWDLTPEQCKEIDTLETGERKIVPVTKLPDGTLKLRDGEDVNYPFHYVEPLLEE